MYSRTKLVLKYLRYYFTAANGKGHGIHSPFVFEFITRVLNDTIHYPEYATIESLREDALKNHKEITINDLGAGSGQTKSNTRTISSIARNAAKPKKFGQLLYRMAKFYKPSTIVELGTSLGFTTAYLATGNAAAKVITMEGSENVLAEAQFHFDRLTLENIRTVIGNFDDVLDPTISALTSIDLAFIDGNHRYEPTLRYFNSLLSKTNNESIIILDDIHWSAEMEKAWEHCKDHSSVTLSIDLFFIGILIFRKEIKEQQHFVIRF